MREESNVAEIRLGSHTQVHTHKDRERERKRTVSVIISDSFPKKVHLSCIIWTL